MGLFGDNNFGMVRRLAGKLGSAIRKVVDFITGGKSSAKDAEEALQEEATRTALEIVKSDLVPLLKEALEREGHVYTGELRDSLDAWPVGEDTIAVGSRTLAERLARVEVGTRPRAIGSAELDRLEDWVQKKWGVSEEEAESAAKTLKDKIEKRGNTAYHTLTRVLESHQSALEKELGQRIALIITRES